MGDEADGGWAMTIAVSDWLVSHLNARKVPSVVIREIVRWFKSPDKSDDLVDRLFRASRQALRERVRKLEITEVEGKAMETLLWKEALRYASDFVSVYLPEATPDYDHYRGVCPYCGVVNLPSRNKKDDFGNYYEYNMFCSSCGRIIPFDYLATCPVCNSGSSIPVSEIARRYMVQMDLSFQRFIYEKEEESCMKTPRFDPELPFVAPVRERKIVPEGTAVLYGIYQDIEHDITRGVSEDFLTSNPPWSYLLFYCPFDFFKWSVYLDTKLRNPELPKTCIYCGSSLKEEGLSPDGYGMIHRCANPVCRFNHRQPTFVRVGVSEPVKEVLREEPIEEEVEEEEEP